MVFRKENKVDAFQRQISALRQQLGAQGSDADESAVTPYPDDQGDAIEHLDTEGFGTREAAGFSFAGFGGTSSSNRPTEPAVPSMSAVPSPTSDPDTSVIAHGTTWKGDLQTNGSVHVHGRVEGSITARHNVYLADEADVDAALTATNIIIAGLAKGTIRCSARFEALPQGRITGDIQAPTLVVHEGATITGRFRMGPPESSQRAEQPAATVVQRRAARGGD